MLAAQRRDLLLQRLTVTGSAIGTVIAQAVNLTLLITLLRRGAVPGLTLHLRPTAFDKKHDHYDAMSDPDKPRWYMVDVKLVRKFDRVITLDELRRHAAGKLKDMIVLKRGNRLSITPVTKSEWSFIESLA